MTTSAQQITTHRDSGCFRNLTVRTEFLFKEPRNSSCKWHGLSREAYSKIIAPLRNEKSFDRKWCILKRLYRQEAIADGIKPNFSRFHYIAMGHSPSRTLRRLYWELLPFSGSITDETDQDLQSSLDDLTVDLDQLKTGLQVSTGL